LTTHERRLTLVDLLRKQPGLRVPELAESLGVSEGTIRNDLNALEVEGRLTRFHGGAMLSDQGIFQNSSFSTRFRENAAEKKVIARYASMLVNDGSSILLDASSTAYYLGIDIQEKKRLRVITNGLDVARLLARNSTNTVILIGGVLNLDGSSVTGLFSENIIEELHIQRAFVSCSGFSLERGMTEVHLAEAQLKRKAIESSSELIALVDSSKFGKEDFTHFARPEQITHLFTDSLISPDWASRLQRARLSVTICEAEVAPIK